MAVDLIAAGVGLMRKLARIGKIMSLVRVWNNTTLPRDTGAFDTLMDQYDTQRSYSPRLVEIHLRQRTATIAPLEEYRQVARETLIEQVMKEADNPPPIPDFRLCVEVLIEEMRDGGSDVNAIATSTGATVTPFGAGNVGNGTFLWTVTRPDGQTGETIFDETVAIRCIRDSYSGHYGRGFNMTQPGSEEFNILGFPAASSTMHSDFANANFGSGANAFLTSCNPVLDNALGNKLVNSDMADWTGATPNNWSKTDAESQISQ